MRRLWPPCPSAPFPAWLFRRRPTSPVFPFHPSPAFPASLYFPVSLYRPWLFVRLPLRVFLCAPCLQPPVFLRRHAFLFPWPLSPLRLEPKEKKARGTQQPAQ